MNAANDLLLIFLGSGLGGVCRYWVFTNIYARLGHQFPYGTLIVNATGCFLMGLMFVVILEKLNGIGEQLRPLILIGFLGGYTTFSAFSIETLTLYQDGAWFAAFLNVFISLFLCISLTWAGMLLGKQL